MNNEAVYIGSRKEMFIDEWLIAHKRNVRLRLHEPQRQEVVLTFDRPWEGPHCGYVTAIRDGGLIRLYYRGYSPDDMSEEQVVCCAESEDGIHFARPRIGLFEFQGTSDNNVVLQGQDAHNFSPFLDGNPKVPAHERYKGVGGQYTTSPHLRNGSMYGYVSTDGIRWSRTREEPIIGDGGFDSQNVAFWDVNLKQYRCYNRYWEPSDHYYRAIQSTLSPNFTDWGPQTRNEYGKGSPLEHFYTNATILCPGAEHLYMAFPMRLFESRQTVEDHPYPGVSDAVMMTSRDGVHWDRTFMEAWLRPGGDLRNWTDRNQMVACGCIETAYNEFSLYALEHYRMTDCRLRRVTVRKHGFASVYAGYGGGEFTTRVVRFAGTRLLLNYATSAAGLIKVEVLDEHERVLPGMSFDDMEPMYGDELEGEVRWTSGASLDAVKNKPVRFRFWLKDADLYALCTSTN
ncbi:hypothetical protein [Paenibacillus eucommiae]|uniref:Glycoside hydrolase family 32 protein n=1 Tax=Paenibacillus eucommiae TaxID=1355755 RepID=A0ABS4J4D9_9BACL|nr:hypothetical protein [Paenibacillus eucommiae]MBP1994702.1 hypothetical protein [Paenibacillus eucommiae]